MLFSLGHLYASTRLSTSRYSFEIGLVWYTAEGIPVVVVVVKVIIGCGWFVVTAMANLGPGCRMVWQGKTKVPSSIFVAILYLGSGIADLYFIGIITDIEHTYVPVVSIIDCSYSYTYTMVETYGTWSGGVFTVRSRLSINSDREEGPSNWRGSNSGSNLGVLMGLAANVTDATIGSRLVNFSDPVSPNTDLSSTFISKTNGSSVPATRMLAV